MNSPAVHSVGNDGAPTTNMAEKSPYWSSVPIGDCKMEVYNSYFTGKLPDSLEIVYPLVIDEQVLTFFISNYYSSNIQNRPSVEYLRWSCGDICLGIRNKSTGKLAAMVGGRLYPLKISGEVKNFLMINSMVIMKQLRKLGLAPLLMDAIYKTGHEVLAIESVIMTRIVDDDLLPGKCVTLRGRRIIFNKITCEIAEIIDSSEREFPTSTSTAMIKLDANDVINRISSRTGLKLQHIPRESDLNQPFVHILGDDKSYIVMSIDTGCNDSIGVEYTIGYVHFIYGDEKSLLQSIIHNTQVDIVYIFCELSSKLDKYVYGNTKINVHMINCKYTKLHASDCSLVMY